MRLKVGDKIYCVADVNDLTKNKYYEVINVRKGNFSICDNLTSYLSYDDICIKDDTGCNWWFGQIGETEPWTIWFISEKEWLRKIKLEKLGI